MRAYKFLLPGAVGPFSGYAWPKPEGDRPGRWVEAGGAPVAPCRVGVHACRVRDLPWWIQAELWEVELGRPVRHVGHKLVAVRGRLLGRCDGWNRESLNAFARVCADRAAEWADAALLAAGDDPEAARISVTMAADADHRAANGHASTAAYIAAHAALQVGGPEAMVSERHLQSSWFRDHLQLAG